MKRNFSFGMRFCCKANRNHDKTGEESLKTISLSMTPPFINRTIGLMMTKQVPEANGKDSGIAINSTPPPCKIRVWIEHR